MIESYYFFEFFSSFSLIVLILLLLQDNNLPLPNLSYTRLYEAMYKVVVVILWPKCTNSLGITLPSLKPKTPRYC